MKHKLWLILIIFLSFDIVYARWFVPDTPPSVVISPKNVCLTHNCNMSSPIYMNNHSIYDAIFINSIFIGNVSLNATDIKNPYWVNKTGDSMSGTLNMQNNDISNIKTITANDWSNVSIYISQIIDLDTLVIDAAQVANPYWLNLSGGTMNGDINMDGNDITNIRKITANDWSNATINTSQIFNYTDSDYCRNGLCQGSLNVSGNNITDVGSLYFFTSNTTYFIYNTTNRTLDLWVNGQRQQSWGHSTVIYQEATFLANAFFQNIFLQSAEGNDLLINTTVIVGKNLTVYEYTISNGTYITDVCHSDGTGCNINGTYLIGVCLTNGTGCPPQVMQILDNIYLYNNNNVTTFNETKLNQTIYDKIKIHIFNTSISVINGTGFNQTIFTFLESAEILRVSVFPTTITNQYKFSANTSITGDFIDTDRRVHSGNWRVAHTGSTIENEEINFYLNNVVIDEEFIVEIRYKI